MGDVAVDQGAAQANGAVVWTLTERDFLESDYRRVRELGYRTVRGFKITPGWLLELAQRAEARHGDLLFRFPPGTVHTERNMMCDLSEHALEAAAWMEGAGLTEAVYAGPFGPALPPRGSKVRLRRGAEVLSTHPKVKRAVLGRDLVVNAHSINSGFIDMTARVGRNEQRVRNPEVHWAGSGGYWRWTDANNILADE